MKYVIAEEFGSCYLRFAVSDGDGGEVEFLTNRLRQGKFLVEGNDVRQTAGTCQFSMPESDSACRRRLRAMLEG